jgi:hypothetical protein
LTKKHPSPSISPASHSFQDFSFNVKEGLEDNGRVVSEVPTKKLDLFVTGRLPDINKVFTL